jgi:hypothetical protein
LRLHYFCETIFKIITLSLPKIKQPLLIFSAQIVIDPNEPDDYCPVCDRHLDDASSVGVTSLASVGVDDPTSVVCLTACQHKCHAVCLKVSICRKQPHCLDGHSDYGDDDQADNAPTYIQVTFWGGLSVVVSDAATLRSIYTIRQMEGCRMTRRSKIGSNPICVVRHLMSDTTNSLISVGLCKYPTKQKTRAGRLL